MAQAECPSLNPDPGPNLLWSDEFDDDLSKWELQTGDGCDLGICGWGNNELQYYKAENAVVSDGTLKINIYKERVRRYKYTSARLRTKGKGFNQGDFTYGRFEARMKLLQGQGLWPAFWMLSTNEPRGGWPQSGEIDIMEFLGQDPKKVFGTVHYGNPWPDNQYQSEDFLLYGDDTFADDDSFHVFAVEWEPGEIRWYVDDVLYSRKTAADIEAEGYDWPFDPIDPHPDQSDLEDYSMHLLLNVAVGGNLPGSPDATTPFPNEVVVDWVRVYDNSVFNPSISGDRLVPYQSSGEIYRLNNAPAGATIDWTVPAGASYAPVPGANAISVDWGGTGGDVVADTTDGYGMPASYCIGVTVEPHDVGDPISLHVESVVTGTESAGHGDKFGTATITIYDNLGAPVSGANVTAKFSGSFPDESVSGETGLDGTVTLKTQDTERGGVTVNVCIDEVEPPAGSTLTYDPGPYDCLN